MDQKPPFLIPLALDIERCGGKWDPDGNGPCHPGIAVTSTDDQRLHALGECRYWEGVTDRVLLRRGSMALLFAVYLLTNGAFMIIAPTLARGGLINSDKCDIYACQPGLPARDVLS